MQFSGVSDPVEESKVSRETPHEKTLLRIESIPTILQSHPWYQSVHSTLYWHDPVKSGLSFAIGNLFFFLMTYGEYSLLTLTTTVFLFVLVGVGGYLRFKREIPDQFNTPHDFEKSRQYITQHVETLVKLVEAARASVTEYLYFTDFSQSAKAGLVAFFLRTLGTFFSDLSLLYFVFLVAFIWPRLYAEKHNEIDLAIKTVTEQVSQKLDPLLQKLPFKLKKQ
jgi:hypothetical protein